MSGPELPDPRLLRLFDLLYDLRNVTRVAEALGCSQPTVSLGLGRLRRTLGDQLFVKTADGMAPTPRADALIGGCRDVLAALAHLTDGTPPWAPQTAQRTFRIAMTDASHLTLLPRLLATLRAEAPSARLVATGIDADTARALDVGEADVAIGRAPWLSPPVTRTDLYQQNWVCVANRAHPRLRAGLSARRYRAEGHVAVTSGTGDELLEQALTRARVDRRVVLELPGFLGLGPIVASTDLLATVPRHIGETLAQRHRLAVHDAPIPIDGFTVALHWHRRYDDDPANRWLRDTVVGLFAQPTPPRSL